MTNTPEPDDTGIGELLREVGARDEPSADITREVEAAVHAEWRALVSERTRVRRRQVFGIAAGLAIVAVSAITWVSVLSPTPTPVASVVRVDGTLLAASAGQPLAPRRTGTSLSTGEIVRTDAHSRAALALADGLSLRLDRDTTVRVVAQDALVLDSGAVYVDSQPQSSSDHPLTIGTHVGSVRHVGTQYEVRTHPGEIAVSIREGRVVIETVSGNSEGKAGERVQVATTGAVTRTRLSPRDDQWRWALEAAPVFDIENRKLAEFLSWVARETGRELAYGSPQAQAAAQEVSLHGSIAGLDLDAALAAVLSSTRLTKHAAGDETLHIELVESGDR